MNNTKIKKPAHSLKEIHEIGIQLIAQSPFAQVVIDMVKQSGGKPSARMKLAPTIVYTVADMMSQGVEFETAVEIARNQLDSMGI